MAADHHYLHQLQQLVQQLAEAFDNMLSAKVITATGALVVAATAAVQQIGPPTRPTEGFWPVTGSGWISLFLSVGGAITMCYGLWRFSQKGLLAELRKVKEELELLKADNARHAREEREHVNRVVAELRHEHREAMEEQEERLEGQALILNGLVTGLAESRLDRANITSGMGELRRQLERIEDAREKRDLELLRLLGEIRNTQRGGGGPPARGR